MKETLEDVQYERDNAVQEAHHARREAEFARTNLESAHAGSEHLRREVGALKVALGRALKLPSVRDVDLVAALFEPVRFMEERRIRVDDVAKFKALWDAIGVLSHREQYASLASFTSERDVRGFVEALIQHVVDRRMGDSAKTLRKEVERARDRARLLELENEVLRNKLAEVTPQSAPGTRRKNR